jgi:hypothetical protein
MASKVVLGIKKQKFAAIPDKFKLPFRIDMTLKANSSDFKLLIGNGGVHFSSPINHSGGGIRRYDILTGKEEPTKSDYENDVPLNEYVDLSVIYGNKITWVEINNKYCYSTRKAPYISILDNLPEEFVNGLDFAVSCGRDVALTIKSLTVTEYENDEPNIYAEIANQPEFSPFEWYLKSLPHELRDEVIKTDEFLLKDMKSSLKFKKSIDKYGNVIYISPCGFQFKMRKYGMSEQLEINPHDSGQLETGWIKNWTKKSDLTPDYTSRIFNRLNESSPEFADKMFSQIKSCNNTKCNRNSIIEYKGESKQTCSSTIKFTWLSSEFENIRKVVSAANEVVKTADVNK